MSKLSKIMRLKFNPTKDKNTISGRNSKKKCKKFPNLKTKRELSSLKKKPIRRSSKTKSKRSSPTD